MQFRAKNTRDSAQGYIQCMKCIGNPVARTDGRRDVRTDGHVTITSLPKFFGLIGYQTAPGESTALSLSFQWSHSRILSSNSKASDLEQRKF